MPPVWGVSRWCAGVPGWGKTEGHKAQDGRPEQVSDAVIGLGQGDLLLQVECELLGAEEREGAITDQQEGRRKMRRRCRPGASRVDGLRHHVGL